jgi:TetR/AcrR family transcriptional regulator, transcriptional repressor for nem operon
MRMTSERKAETRDRILSAAGELFRSHGIDAVGVDAIMHRAGLTHGGFYAHFASKEALVAEVSAAALARSAARWERISQEEAEPAAALSRIVESYLDPAHVAAAARGCILTTLGPEIARRDDARPAITTSIRRMLDVLAGCLPAPCRQRALTTLSAMVGAVVLARLCDDSRLADEFLAAGRRAAGPG